MRFKAQKKNPIFTSLTCIVPGIVVHGAITPKYKPKKTTVLHKPFYRPLRFFVILGITLQGYSGTCMVQIGFNLVNKQLRFRWSTRTKNCVIGIFLFDLKNAYALIHCRFSSWENFRLFSRAIKNYLPQKNNKVYHTLPVGSNHCITPDLKWSHPTHRGDRLMGNITFRRGTWYIKSEW